ncbi:MAG: DUF362 domain-containing protein [Fibrobacterota bacterium]
MKKICTMITISLLLTAGVIFAQRVKPFVYSAQCVGCGDCVRICPRREAGAITISDGKAVIDPEVCIACNRCVQICSFDAVK